MPVLQSDGHNLGPGLVPSHSQNAGDWVELSGARDEGHRSGPYLFIGVIDVRHSVEELEGYPVAHLDCKFFNSGHVNPWSVVDIQYVESNYSVREFYPVAGPQHEIHGASGVVV